MPSKRQRTNSGDLWRVRLSIVRPHGAKGRVCALELGTAPDPKRTWYSKHRRDARWRGRSGLDSGHELLAPRAIRTLGQREGHYEGAPTTPATMGALPQRRFSIGSANPPRRRLAWFSSGDADSVEL